jgi:tetratricopeptide (TPR) repeat protein
VPNESYDLFISYRSTDVAPAEELCRRLVAEGFTVWFDRARLDPGCRWHDEIEAGCENSRIILPVLTPSWQESEWCRFETYGAEHVVPLLYAGTWLEVAPPPIRALQYVDLREPRRADWRSLVEALRGHLRQDQPVKASRLALLPYPHNPYFVGRERLLLDLHERLCRAPTAALAQTPAVAVVGLGGVGKTTLAREYADKFWRLYRQILWIQGDASSFPAEFARLAVELRLVSVPSKDADEDAHRMLRELNGQIPRLLIIDNAVDETSISRWLPTAGACRTIITSRFNGWSAGIERVPVEELTSEAAQHFLIQRAGMDAGAVNRLAVEKVASELGCLPLAIEQAAAFISKLRIDFARYLEFYAEARARVLAEHVPGSTSYPDSVAGTWRVTVGRLSPLSRALLRLTAFLAPTPITIVPLEEAAKLFIEATDMPRDAGEAITMTPLDIRLALGELAAYSMIKLHTDTLTVHRLVQAVQRDDLDDAGQQQEVKRAVAFVSRAFPGPELERADWPSCELLLPHAVQCVAHIDRWALQSVQAKDLLDRVADYLDARGLFTAEEPFAKRALAIEVGMRGSAHSEVARRLTTLALIAMNDQRYDDAHGLAAQALAICETAGTRDDVQMARALNVMGLIFDNVGLQEEAEACYRRALPIFEHHLGEESADVASNLNNLGINLDRQGRYVEAEACHRRALAIRRRAAHPDDVANSLSNLAVLLDNQRRFADADPLYREALPILRDALGPAHPHVAALLRKHATSLRLWRKSSGVIGNWLFRLRTGRHREAEAHKMEDAAARIEAGIET